MVQNLWVRPKNAVNAFSAKITEWIYRRNAQLCQTYLNSRSCQKSPSVLGRLDKWLASGHNKKRETIFVHLKILGQKSEFSPISQM